MIGCHMPGEDTCAVQRGTSSRGCCAGLIIPSSEGSTPSPATNRSAMVSREILEQGSFPFCLCETADRFQTWPGVARRGKAGQGGAWQGKAGQGQQQAQREANNMELITVDKTQLLEKLRTERDSHKEIFERALEKYRERVVEELERRLTDIRAGKKIQLAIGLPIPEDHTKDYTTVIEMLEWDKGDEIELDMRDFARYVLGRWEWRDTWTANTASYVPGADM